MACRIGTGIERGMVEPPKTVTMKPSPILYHRQGAIKPHVGIERSNLVSRDILETPVRAEFSGVSSTRPQPPNHVSLGESIGGGGHG